MWTNMKAASFHLNYFESRKRQSALCYIRQHGVLNFLQKAILYFKIFSTFFLECSCQIGKSWKYLVVHTSEGKEICKKLWYLLPFSIFLPFFAYSAFLVLLLSPLPKKKGLVGFGNVYVWYDMPFFTIWPNKYAPKKGYSVRKKAYQSNPLLAWFQNSDKIVFIWQIQ